MVLGTCKSNITHKMPYKVWKVEFSFPFGYIELGTLCCRMFTTLSEIDRKTFTLAKF